MRDGLVQIFPVEMHTHQACWLMGSSPTIVFGSCLAAWIVRPCTLGIMHDMDSSPCCKPYVEQVTFFMWLLALFKSLNLMLNVTPLRSELLRHGRLTL